MSGSGKAVGRQRGVSVIVPVLNEEERLPVLLGQLARLGASEVIVADGGSTDKSVELAAGSKVVRSPRGRARQMNSGAVAASHQVLLFLHADTMLPDGALEMIETAMADPAVAGGRFKVRLDNDGLAYRLVGAMINLRDGFTGGFTGDQAIFVRREVFERLGGYADIPLMEDLDFARRLKRSGKVVRIPAKVMTSARRWEKDGLVKTIALMWYLRILYLLGVPPAKLKALYKDTR